MKRLLIASLLLVGLTGCMSQPDYRAVQSDPETVASVDIDKYAGKWFEIARYPNSFERDCVGVTAEYTQHPDGKLTVTNTCFEERLDGKKRVSVGRARIVEGSNNSKLKVKFAPAWVPFASGDYWILHLETDYSAALVGDPSGKYLWILAREPKISDALMSKITGRANELGYQTEPLYMTPQQ